MNRLRALIVIHIAAGIVFCLANNTYRTTWTGVSFAALSFGQCALLAVWSGFTTTPQLPRYAATGLGGAYLWFTAVVATGNWQFGNARNQIALAILVAACLIPVVAVFRVLQKCGPRLTAYRTDSESSAAHEPFQFSTKHLFLLAFGVACAIGFGRALQTFKVGAEANWLNLSLMFTVLGLCTLHLVLAAVWACLAVDKVRVRKTLTCAATVLAALIPPFCFNVTSPLDYVAWWASVVGAQAVTMMSLDVARSEGFRVTRAKSAPRQSQDEIALARLLN